MPRQELLMELSREDDLLRRQASRAVERGYDELLGCKRLVQRLTLTEEEEAQLYTSLIKLNNAGIALRVMLQIQVKHEQRLENAWADVEGSNGKLQSAALEYESDVNNFLMLLREAVKVNRLEMKDLKDQHKQPEETQDWAPAGHGSPSSSQDL